MAKQQGRRDRGQTEPLLYDIRTAARLLSVSYGTVWTLLKKGALPEVRIRGCVRIPASALRALIDRNTHAAGVGP